MTVRSAAESPRKSGMSTSTVVSGVRWRTARIVAAKMPAPAVGQLVPIHRGDDGVPQSHDRHRVRDAFRFFPVQPGGKSGGDRAEPAGPGAYFSQDHEGGGSLAPAFRHIRTARLPRRTVFSRRSRSWRRSRDQVLPEGSRTRSHSGRGPRRARGGDGAITGSGTLAVARVTVPGRASGAFRDWRDQAPMRREAGTTTRRPPFPGCPPAKSPGGPSPRP